MQEYSAIHSHPRRYRVTGDQRHAPAASIPVKNPGTKCTGGWMDLGASQDECSGEEISCPHWSSLPEPAIRVPIPPELYPPLNQYKTNLH